MPGVYIVDIPCTRSGTFFFNIFFLHFRPVLAFVGKSIGAYLVLIYIHQRLWLFTAVGCFGSRHIWNGQYLLVRLYFLGISHYHFFISPCSCCFLRRFSAFDCSLLSISYVFHIIIMQLCIQLRSWFFHHLSPDHWFDGWRMGVAGVMVRNGIETFHIE